MTSTYRGRYRREVDDGHRRGYKDDSYSGRSRQVRKDLIKPIPIDLKPSGILTKYLHLTTDNVKPLIDADVRNKYSPPEDAVIPDSINCKIHIFKYNEDTNKQTEIPLYNFKSFFIIGRDEELSDITISKDNEDGDLVSKQHLVIQFRKNNNGIVNCYILDLGSTNGTFLNDADDELPKKRFIQLKNKDVFRLGDPDSVLEFMVIEDQ